MVQAIGSSAGSGAISTGAAAAGLEAQLTRYQKQLSECVNCASSRTAEGKAEIEAISARISEVRARIEKVTSPNAGNQAGPIASGTGVNSLVRPPSPWTTIGSLIDVQA